jgi:hypothetical protein
MVTGQDLGQGFFDWEPASAPVLDSDRRRSVTRIHVRPASTPVLHKMTSEYDFGTGMDMMPDGSVKHLQPVSVSASALQFQEQWPTVDLYLVDFNMGP